MDEIDRLEAEAGRRRSQLEGTLGQLQQRLRPVRFMDEAIGLLGPAPVVTQNAATALRRHPLAAALLVASAGWLVWQTLKVRNQRLDFNPVGPTEFDPEFGSSSLDRTGDPRLLPAEYAQPDSDFHR